MESQDGEEEGWLWLPLQIALARGQQSRPRVIGAAGTAFVCVHDASLGAVVGGSPTALCLSLGKASPRTPREINAAVLGGPAAQRGEGRGGHRAGDGWHPLPGCQLAESPPERSLEGWARWVVCSKHGTEHRSTFCPTLSSGGSFLSALPYCILCSSVFEPVPCRKLLF